MTPVLEFSTRPEGNAGRIEYEFAEPPVDTMLSARIDTLRIPEMVERLYDSTGVESATEMLTVAMPLPPGPVPVTV